MIFETSDKNKAGKSIKIAKGLTKRYIARSRKLNDDFLKRYDLIHIWGRFPIASYRVYSDLLIPHCYTLHSAVSILDWIVANSPFYIPESDVVTLGSRYLADVLVHFWKIPVNVIPYGVDTQIFRPLSKYDCREQLNIPKERFILGYLGRPEKLDFLLAYDTLKKIKNITGRSDITLLVAGGTRKIEPIYVTNDFIYLGYLDSSEVSLMLNSCDIFFNPVASIQEGFGLTVIEAMACGLPIVTTYWNCYRETVGNAGFLARTCWAEGDIWVNQNDLVSACVRLIENENLRKKCAKEARKRVEEKYRWEYCVESYKRLFLSLIQDSQKNICIKERKAYVLTKKIEKVNDHKADFQWVTNFTSDRELHRDNWWKITCKDNILTLPKYRLCMKSALVKEEEKLKRHFPKLLRALKS